MDGTCWVLLAFVLAIIIYEIYLWKSMPVSVDKRYALYEQNKDKIILYDEGSNTDWEIGYGHRGSREVGYQDRLINGHVGRIEVKKRCPPMLRESFYIVKHKTSSYKYNTPQVTYTSVTVGGVTTGGFSKTGGDYSTKSWLSNKGHVVMINSLIREIEFDKSLEPELKRTSFSKYVQYGCSESDKPTIYLYDPKRASSMADAVGFMYYQGGNQEQAMNLLEAAKLEAYPLTYEVCSAIVDWICSDYSCSE